MPEGLDATSFDFYEGIRILVPGATALAVGEGLARTFSDSGEGLELGSIAYFFIALLIGLLFYCVDAPTRAAIFAPLQPTDLLYSWPVYPKQGTKTINSYFVMLDTVIPASIRARALYMGTMYRIGFEMIYILAVPSLVVVSSALYTTDELYPEVSQFGLMEMALVAFTLLVWMITLRRDTRPGAMSPWSELDVASRKFSRVDLVLVISAFLWFGALTVYSDRFQGWVFLLPTAAVTALWARRYLKGYSRELGWRDGARAVTYACRHAIKMGKSIAALRRGTREGNYKFKSSRRHPVAGCQAVFLLGSANLLAVASEALRAPSEAGVSAHEKAFWFIAMGVALGLVGSRGHEKRLRGAYMTQNTWLTLNSDSVIERFFDRR